MSVRDVVDAADNDADGAGYAVEDNEATTSMGMMTLSVTVEFGGASGGASGRRTATHVADLH